MSRLPVRSGEQISRATKLRFTFDGRGVEAYEGDTVGSALYAAGQRTFSRSFKYHRRRGLLCCSGQCPNCLVAVDGAPGIRACREPVREGIKVEHMNAWPSLRFDVMRMVDLLGSRLTPPGFYYKTFIRPRRLWPLYERLLRRAAGLGRLPERQQERTYRSDYRRRHADVLVVGGGAAGLSAARRAAELGADTVLVDEGHSPGGRLFEDGEPDRARRLTDRAREAGVELLSPATALGYFDGLVPVSEGRTLHQVRARRLIVASGTIEQPLIFPGNDLPGVMLSGGALRLLNLYSVSPGRRAVVATVSDRGLEAALALQQAGVELAAVADLRPVQLNSAAERLVRAGVTIMWQSTVTRAEGRGTLRRVLLATHDSEGRATGKPHEVSCDLLVISGPESPAKSLLLQAGAEPSYASATGHFTVGQLPEGVLVAGSVAGLEAERSGRAAGEEAADGPSAGERSEDIAANADSESAVPPASQGDDSVVCLCEDISAKDIAHAAAEGYDSVELCKRYTTATMGPCQGRMCQLAAVRTLAEATGATPAETGLTVARPPWSPVPMGVLAGRPLEPAKRSAIHSRHRASAGNIMWAGDWRRPYDYGDPHAEVLAVHNAAGLIDLSSLGKLLIQGRDAGAFLDRIYPNRLSNLKSGRIRYGVVISDAGRVLDDGTVCRLDDETFYVTTTSSGAGAVEEWFSWWLAEWRMEVRVTDMTQTLCAVNLAGPEARRILSSLAPELDCSAETFGYLDAHETQVAGVPSLVSRIGFVGELGYEIHFPSAFGTHIWDAALTAGQEYGIRPFGLEPQRVLRLQKLHVIVGQDTDSESSPYEAAMPWIVKLDKEHDFVGRWALEARAQQPPRSALVGFTVPDGTVPSEGAAVVVDGRSAGRVTSARFSPKLNGALGLAVVPADHAVEGHSVTIDDGEASLDAVVALEPFYDPDGERQKA